jgi:hypothetical protein
MGMGTYAETLARARDDIRRHGCKLRGLKGLVVQYILY